MLETVVAFLDNGVQDSSDVNENLGLPRTPDRLLREGHAGRIEAVSKHVRGMALHSTEIEESSNYDRSKSPRVSSDFGSIIELPELKKVSNAPPLVTFHALQEWEGYVLEKRADEFTARLLDLTAGSSHEEEEATIPLEEIAEDDYIRVIPGSIFRWVIGYERSASGTKRRVSQIVFRDLPAITKQDMFEAKEWARKIVQLWSD